MPHPLVGFVSYPVTAQVTGSPSGLEGIRRSKCCAGCDTCPLLYQKRKGPVKGCDGFGGAERAFRSPDLLSLLSALCFLFFLLPCCNEREGWGRPYGGGSWVVHRWAIKACANRLGSGLVLAWFWLGSDLVTLI